MLNKFRPILSIGLIIVQIAISALTAGPAAEASAASTAVPLRAVLPAWATAALPDSSGRALPAWFAGANASAEPETYTDGAGRYRFEGLPHGTHKVTIDLSTLPDRLYVASDETAPILWLTPGMAQTSDALSNGVRFTAAYDRPGGTIAGLVFVDRDGDGQQGADEPGVPGVRVVDPTLHQFFVPFDDRNLWTLFQEKAACHGGHAACGPLMSHIGLTASSDGTVYYYDHWEDGYDADPLTPGPTTEVGVLDAGGHQHFEDDIDPSLIGIQLYYDGRDRLTVVGEPVAVVRTAHPASYSMGGTCPGAAATSGWLASAWEVLEVADWGTEYHATVGEDLDYSGGTPDDHDFAGLEVMAWQDGTVVYYNGSPVGTLNAGETYFVPGANDGPGGGGVDSIDNIAATAPIQVNMMTGACSTRLDEFVSAHGYTLQPRDAWNRAYWAPVPGFEQGCDPDEDRNVDTDIYLHNGQSYDITVVVDSGAAVANVVVQAETTVSVLDETGWSDLATGNQGTYLSSSEPFWGMVVVDSATNGATAADDYDWGYSLIPEYRLSSQVIVGDSPGNGDDPPADNGNLAFVVAVTDTVLYADLDLDGLPDAIDMNGDGDADDNDVWGEPAWDEPLSALGVPLQAGQVLRMGDPNDRNLLGALVYTSDLAEHIAVAWGQDPCRANLGAPYVDLGYTILPVTIPSLSKVDELAVDADLSGNFSPGDTLTYTMVLFNNGMASMNEVVLTDSLPYTYTDFVVGSLEVSTPPPVGDFEYSNDGVDFTAPENPDIQAFRITWPTIEPLQGVTIAFRVRLQDTIPATVTQITNEAVVDSANTDPVYSQDPDDLPDPDTDTPVEPGAEIRVEKTGSPSPIVPGNPMTYSLTVYNDGQLDAENVLVTDTLPAEVTFTDADPYPNVSDVNPLVWDLGTLGAGLSQTILITVQVEPWVTDTFVNHVVVSTTTSGDDPSNNQDDFPAGPSPDVEVWVEKTGSPSPVVPGNPMTYSLTVYNDGPFAAEDVLVTDTLPSEVTFTDADPYPNVSDVNPLVWDLGTLGAGANRSILITVGVEPWVTEPFTNYVAVSTSTPGDDPGNNQDDYPAWPALDAEIRVEKTGSPSPIVPGNPMTYSLTVYNDGSSDAENVLVTDTLPAEVTFADADPYPNVSDVNPLVWDLGTLGAGLSQTILITVQVEPWVTDTFVNYVVVSTTTSGDDPANNQDDFPAGPSPDVEVWVEKTGSPSPVVPGNPMTYSLTVYNDGPFAAEDVLVTDTLPSEVTFADADPYPNVSDVNPLVWDLGTLGAGANRSILITVGVESWVTEPFTNYVAVSTSTPGDDPGNNQDDYPVDVEGDAIELLYFRATPLPGAVLLEWETAVEIDNYGFFLLRSTSGRFDDAEEIAFVPAAGFGRGGGASYRFKDITVLPEVLYTYWLVDLDTSGHRTVHGPVEVTSLFYQLYLPIIWR